MTVQRGGWSLAMLGATLLASGLGVSSKGMSPAGAAQTTPAAITAGVNPYNDQLLRLQPQQQAAALAHFLGATCIGTKPFLMGITKEGPAKGFAYWSLECAGGNSYMIQLDRNGGGAAIDCRTLKENGEGRECYKAF